MAQYSIFHYFIYILYFNVIKKRTLKSFYQLILSNRLAKNIYIIQSKVSKTKLDKTCLNLIKLDLIKHMFM